MPLRFLVMGCGAVGGIVASHLLESGQDVAAYSSNAGIADAIDARGYQLRGEGPARSVPGRVHREVPPGPFEVVVLATQPTHVEDAARTALPSLAPDGVMVCLQNGLCEERVARIVGDARTGGAVVSWGAAMPEPGLYDRTAAGGFTLGRLDASSDPRLEEIARALECVGPTEITGNLAGKRWSKLAINCAISSMGTLGGDRLGPLLQHRFVRRLALEVMTEVVHVARRERITLEKVSGTLDLEWIALTDEERRASGSPALLAKHALLYAVGLRFRRMRSSMLAAIERGREPAVDFLNGEVIDRGRRHGIPTPVNDRIRSLVWEVAARRRTPSLDLLRDVAS
ncbi:MAG TPA: 2-dehydropantoate 2-reductase [Polyangiaceae bacterium]|nr:2-dehydropantoate 2-reductase [Polyangiaceae bacterium]